MVQLVLGWEDGTSTPSMLCQELEHVDGEMSGAARGRVAVVEFAGTGPRQHDELLHIRHRHAGLHQHQRQRRLHPEKGQRREMRSVR